MVKHTRLHNVDELRSRIDRGLTGDKIPHPDPAFVPLGTDAEAGGNPPTAVELAIEAKALGSTPRTTRWSDDTKGVIIYAMAVGVFVAAVLTIIVLSR